MTYVSAKYGTKNPVLIEARVNHDPYDEFAWVQGWRFSICQHLADRGVNVPDFRGADDIRKDYEYESLWALKPTTDETLYALGILDRYREWLRVAGKDY